MAIACYPATCVFVGCGAGAVRPPTFHGGALQLEGDSDPALHARVARATPVSQDVAWHRAAAVSRAQTGGETSTQTAEGEIYLSFSPFSHFRCFLGRVDVFHHVEPALSV